MYISTKTLPSHSSSFLYKDHGPARVCLQGFFMLWNLLPNFPIWLIDFQLLDKGIVFLLSYIKMANKSSRSNSGEEPKQPVHRRDTGIEQEDIRENSSEFISGKSRQGQQENLKQRGYEEDQPSQPVRNIGNVNEQSDKPAGEPETEEQQQ